MRLGIFLGFIASVHLFAAVAASDKKVILRFDSQVAAEDIQQILTSEEIASYEVLVPSLNIYSVEYKQPGSTRRAMGMFQRSSLVKYVQPDHRVTLRQAPNDPLFSKLWSLNDEGVRGTIGATRAWDYGTGGKDAQGNDIVVAIIDGGFDITHKDLADNVWVNRGEIAGNGKDDDGNGYIDDVNGWNAFAGNGTLPVAFHGTHVAGIVGAKGNNSLQVSGINWQTRLMLVAGASGETSVVLKAYNYVLEQKKKWIATGGIQGANIVVTNSSFGVDGARCDGEFQAWNDIYSAMGEVGILSAVATANAAVDVDKEGDVPTGCSSQYLIKVTNTTIDDEKYGEAGFGKTTIDVGAPGTDILSLAPGNLTRKATGTSMATPHVAGTVALLHSIASRNYSSYYQAQPGKAALLLKKVILDTVDPLSSLKDVTTSGGRINLLKAASKLVGF